MIYDTLMESKEILMLLFTLSFIFGAFFTLLIMNRNSPGLFIKGWIGFSLVFILISFFSFYTSIQKEIKNKETLYEFNLIQNSLLLTSKKTEKENPYSFLSYLQKEKKNSFQKTLSEINKDNILKKYEWIFITKEIRDLKKFFITQKLKNKSTKGN